MPGMPGAHLFVDNYLTMTLIKYNSHFRLRDSHLSALSNFHARQQRSIFLEFASILRPTGTQFLSRIEVVRCGNAATAFSACGARLGPEAHVRKTKSASCAGIQEPRANESKFRPLEMRGITIGHTCRASAGGISNCDLRRRSAARVPCMSEMTNKANENAQNMN